MRIIFEVGISRNVKKAILENRRSRISMVGLIMEKASFPF